jgi:cyclopropane-fatty-acyl-phospholipid synthase
MPRASSSDRFCRGLLLRRLAEFRDGALRLSDADGTHCLGDSSRRPVRIEVVRPRFYRHAVLGGSLSAAESYLCGDWNCDDLVELFRTLVRNRRASSKLESLARWTGWGRRLYHWRHANSRRGSRRNIADHYDLGNDFFQLWLDDTLAYSCGIFAAPGDSLQRASRRKFQTACQKLDLRPEDRVLEIGGGWGGFAVHAAANFGSRVTTTTISRRQFDLARTRIQAAGVGDKVTLLDVDYRDLEGRYDKLVSIEMIEAVGSRRFDAFFRKCSQLLAEDGAMLLQAIVMADRNYASYLRSVDFIQRYVFPGGCLPSLSAIADSVARATDLQIVQVDDYAPHYAETLRRWRSNFEAQLPAVRSLGYSERFIRLWRYYLCYCEAAFEENAIGLVQIRLDKPRRRRATTSSAAQPSVNRLAASRCAEGADAPKFASNV